MHCIRTMRWRKDKLAVMTRSETNLYILYMIIHSAYAWRTGLNKHHDSLHFVKSLLMIVGIAKFYT